MNKEYKFRSAFLLLVFLTLYIVLLITLYSVQIRQADFFSTLGEKQYEVSITTTPPRAPIYDRSGKNMLAMNKDIISAFVLPKKINAPHILEPFLKKYFPGVHKRLSKNWNMHFMFVK